MTTSKLKKVTLEDKYALTSGQIYLSGVQALVRLPMMQRIKDQAAGLNTAGFISGYRGSPLGALDLTLWQAKKYLEPNHIHFEPGLNEDLGATAVWGSQQTNLFKGAQFDGVFGMWYGKGPGVDRSGDVFKHANVAGTSKHGGVLALAGDDHTCKSSTFPHQSDQALVAAFIPILSPSSVQDILDMGLYGWALSRYSGCWVGFKVIADTVDTSASVTINPKNFKINLPKDFVLPPEGLHIRWPDVPVEQERRLLEYKLPAVKAFTRVNAINKLIFNPKSARIGIMASGKSYHDVRQALDNLGLSEKDIEKAGISPLKIGLVWPLEPSIIAEFSKGLKEIVVVEEKRPLIEQQLKELFYNQKTRPVIIGKQDEAGNNILKASGELSAEEITTVLSKRFEKLKIDFKKQTFEKSKKETPQILKRVPYYCSGCPHNTSTRVPEGSRAMAGIGCHYMATWIDHSTFTFTQMGGEGVPWVGQSPFTNEKHVFSNLGDGTYFHSGTLAIRQAVSAGVNITYKVLYNDAVAMTGGQPVEGGLTVAQITKQLDAEGVKKIAVVSDDIEKYSSKKEFAPKTTFHHRRELTKIQEDFRELEGVTAIVYDQTCAAEKRRRRKRGLMEDPKKRVFINERVCEGCGDCGKVSNCLSVVPEETEFGTKRKIDQSTCNKDYSCVDGFCPSFVTVHGGDLKKKSPAQSKITHKLKEPKTPTLASPYNILVTGVGGTGVVTIGALLGMAAHLEGKGCSIVDMTGLAQKGGAVLSHVRIAKKPKDIHATRVPAQGANLVLGCDIVVATGEEALSVLNAKTTHLVINEEETITGDFTQDPNKKFPGQEMRDLLKKQVGEEKNISFVGATELATALLGNSIATNMFMLGYAYQKGYIPLSKKSLIEAITLNGVAVEMNLKAFEWGRVAAENPEKVMKAAGVSKKETMSSPKTLQEVIEHRTQFLTKYQNKRYAKRYVALVERVLEAEQNIKQGSEDLTRAVATYYAKLLAYKDEYEVARLYTDGAFKKALKEQFEGNYKLQFYLAPPALSKKDPHSGKMTKKEYGPWVFNLFKVLSGLRFLRGTPLDIFGYTQDRKQERALIKEYEGHIGTVLKKLSAKNLKACTELAPLAEQIRGYGHVKDENITKVRGAVKALLKSI